MSELDSAVETIFLCKNGARSAQAVRMMREAGFGKVWNVKGGLWAWHDDVDSTVPRY
jgi:adenylyltransferase/sulfurtransferase